MTLISACTTLVLNYFPPLYPDVDIDDDDGNDDKDVVVDDDDDEGSP